MKIEVTWSDFKAQVSAGLPYRYLSMNSVYYLYAVDGNFEFECLIHQNGGDDQVDFESNYKTTAFTTFSQVDTDGAQITRNKAAKKGWTFCALPFELETARLASSLYSKDSAGNDRNFITLKAYDADNQEVTTAGVLDVNYESIVKTVIDFEPPFDFEIVGGELRTLTSIASDLRLWIIAVPDVPANFGGSKEMGGGINLKYLSPGNIWSVDGRVTKFAAYSATLHTNKIRMIFKYPAGTHESLQVVIQLYKL